MTRIDIDHASVSYFIRKKGDTKKPMQLGSVGAQILIGRSYLEITALRDITLSIRSGDRVGLIGVNGSGKSTLLKLCAGALSTKSGSLTIEGRISPQFALGSGMKQSLTGRRNTELKCLYMGISQRSIAARVEEIKELSGLGGYFELPIYSYSAGMKSRLVMSLMQLVRADILVMDEWIAAADASVNKMASQLQSRLIEQSSILVIASHSEAILNDWTTSLVWLDRGEIRAVGATRDVYRDYLAWLAKRV